MGPTQDGGNRTHALVVGGTGMLRGLSLGLAGQGYTVSVIARNNQRLHSLAEAAAEFSGHINPIAVDYGQGEQLRASLVWAIEAYGPVVLAVCWIHSSAPEALRQVAEAIAASSTSCRLFHVRGSAAANPAEKAKLLPEWLDRYPQIRYRQVILGFVVEPEGSRWLTHQEIGDGVLAAVRNAVLKEIDQEGVDQIVCLGDVAATGAQPRECVRLLRELGCPVVMGGGGSLVEEGGGGTGWHPEG